jgi:hypothetical protein
MLRLSTHPALADFVQTVAIGHVNFSLLEEYHSKGCCGGNTAKEAVRGVDK